MSRRLYSSIVVVALLVGACTPTAEPTPQAPEAAQIVACFDIEPAPCNALVRQVSAVLPAGRGQPMSVQVALAACDGPPCGPGLISGQVTAEWVDGGEPVMVGFLGPAAAPEFDVVEDATWTGVVQPKSDRVAPGVPVPFTLGHCGLLHVVDFDGSFWVPVGQVDQDAPEMINAADGQMQLVAPNRAQFAKGGKLIATLARFPGPKHFWLCA